MGLASLLLAAPSFGQLLPWEVTVAEIEAGRIRGLAERIARQNVQYQLHVAGIRKAEVVETVRELDRVLDSLQRGNPAYSIPAPWTGALRDKLQTLDAEWGPIRKIAVATPYDYFRVARQFRDQDSLQGDPLLLRYFDGLTAELVKASEALLATYHEECVKAGVEICDTARGSGYASMLIERATRAALYIASGIDVAENRKRLDGVMKDYASLRAANDASPFFAAALAPERGVAARANAELLASLREDWDAMNRELAALGTETADPESDLAQLLAIQERLVGKVQRFTAALIRYASLAYGS